MAQLFAILAAASAAVALLILLVVPDAKQARTAGSTPRIGFLAIFRDPRFRRMAPLSATGVGVSWSAMAAGLALRLISLAVFFAPKHRAQPIPMAHAVAKILGMDISAAEIMPSHYRAALSAWREHVAYTRRQATAWRFAAVASMALCVGLAGALSLALVPRP